MSLAWGGQGTRTSHTTHRTRADNEESYPVPIAHATSGDSIIVYRGSRALQANTTRLLGGNRS
jgi:hypothetical protein